MRGQFYIISATVIIVIVTTLVAALQSMNPNLMQPISEGAGFPAYNAYRAAADITRTAQTAIARSGRAGIAEELLPNFTAESSAFAEKNGIKIKLDYKIERKEKDNTTINYTLSFKSDKTSLKDSFTISAISRWRQRVNVSNPTAAQATGQVTTRLNFTDHLVANCSGEARLYDGQTQQPANVTGEEYGSFTNWHYQIPLTVSAGAYNRTNTLLEPTIEFTQQLKGIYNASHDFDINSVRLIEQDDAWRVLREVPSQFVPISQYHFQSNATGKVTWIMNGTTPAGTTRRYTILFDTLDNGAKNASNYPTDLTLTDKMTDECYLEVNNSKISYRIRKGGCWNDAGNAGGLKNAWIRNGSGYDIISSVDSYGQYFRSGSDESGPITSYTISAGNITRIISYKTTAGIIDFTVNITAYSTVPYYRMDVSTGAPWSSNFSPSTEHQGGYLCEWRQDANNSWSEMYSPFWQNEGYGVVGLNASVIDLLNANYSCSRILHTVYNLRNWTLYTIFRTPQFTTEDLYLEKAYPPGLMIGNAEAYSGYCTSANITFGIDLPPASSKEYQLYYGKAGTPASPYGGGTPLNTPVQILPEEQISETKMY